MEQLKNFTFERFCQAHKTFGGQFGTPEQEEHDKQIAYYLPDLREGLLAYLDKNPHLKEIKGLNGHQTRYSLDWIQLIEGQSPRYGTYFDLEKALVHVILFEFFYEYEAPNHLAPVDKLPEYYQQLVTFTKTWAPIAHSGNKCGHRIFLMRSDGQPCHECGTSIKFELFKKDGTLQPMMAQFDKDEKGQWGYRIAPQCPATQDNESVTVTFKSSVVYASDWFRLPGFSKIVDDDGSKQFEKMDSRIDFANIAKRYARDHNFVKVSMGNSSPHIYQKNNEILVARQQEVDDYDEATDTFFVKPELEASLSSKFGFEEKGYVCTDLWATCLIDHVTLADILTKAGTPDPEAEIKKWLEDPCAHKLVLEVEPGTYEYCFNGYYHEFEKRREGQKFSDLRLYATVSRKN